MRLNAARSSVMVVTSVMAITFAVGAEPSSTDTSPKYPPVVRRFTSLQGLTIVHVAQLEQLQDTIMSSDRLYGGRKEELKLSSVEQKWERV
jgi:hypothetical protein